MIEFNEITPTARRIEFIDEMNDSVINEEQTILKPCRCGSFEHKTTKHSKFPQNKKYLNQIVEPNELRNQIQINNIRNLEYTKETQITSSQNKHEKELDKYRNIARQVRFSTDQVFGDCIQNDKTKEKYGRHILPIRDRVCTNC